MFRYDILTERYELSEPFGIARGVVTAIDVVEVALADALGNVGRGECRPYPRYEETPESVTDEIEAVARAAPNLVGLDAALRDMPSGAARNALSSALLDLRLKQDGENLLSRAGLHSAADVVLATAETVSLASPDDMGRRAAKLRDMPLLKVKLDSDDISARLRAVRENAPDARIIVDANEAWTLSTLLSERDMFVSVGVEMIEQPIAASDDAALMDLGDYPIPIVADESLYGDMDPRALMDRYQGVNIKLDKAGGPDRAAVQMARAKALGLKVMVGCMVSSSLAIAPAIPLALNADWVDLDGPRWLKDDIDGGFYFSAEGIRLRPPWISGGDWSQFKIN